MPKILYNKDKAGRNCPKCHKHKSFDEFPKRGLGRKNEQRYYPYCKSCHVLYQREQNLKMQRVHNITWQEYQAILAWQDNGCAICHAQGKNRLSVDHDHKTGLVRGLLCSDCNRGIGKFRDNIERLHNSAYYLTNPPAKLVIGDRQVRLQYKRSGGLTVKRGNNWPTIKQREKLSIGV